MQVGTTGGRTTAFRVMLPVTQLFSANNYFDFAAVTLLLQSTFAAN